MDSTVVFIAQYLYLIIITVAVVFFLMQPHAVQKSMVICGVIIAPLAYIISKIASYFYYDSRPFVVGHFTPLFTHIADNGFPSDHILLTGAVAMIVWFYNKKLSVALWILTLLIGLARVYSGVHHTTDIIGSVLVVLMASAIYLFLARRFTLR